MSHERFAKVSLAILLYNLLVIVWGAFVRASLSGDGCGAHWPLCDGEVVPPLASTAQIIEFVHRLSSGIVLLSSIWMLVAARRVFPRGHPVRLTAFFVLFFTLTEAALGAALVLFGWVALDDSYHRAIAMSFHLVNTFLLVGALTLTIYFAFGGPRLAWRNQGILKPALLFGLLGVLVLGVSGAVTALGDTLYPAKSLAEGIRQDFSPTASLLVRLRLFHPLIATSVGLYLILIIGLANYLRPSSLLLRFSKWVAFFFVAQMALGFLNVYLMAPVWLQLVHLALADALWIAVILSTAAALGEGVQRVELGKSHVPPTEEALERPHGLALIKDYFLLTKPRVISLLLFTTLMAMLAAAEGWPGAWLFLAVAIGGYMAAGGANAINMVVERDLDAQMKRTSGRPIVTRHISSRQGLAFGLGLAAGSFVLLWSAANLLTAVLALAGLVYYVFVYTLWLKRRTWQNIVIGGAAGAFPPLVGWASVTGNLSPLAWWLFLIVFMWTPVHFWALSLLIKDDYARARVPMLPVVLGERVTVIQIGLYTVATAIVSVMPLLQRDLGPAYLAGAALLNLILFARSLQLYRKPERPQAVSLYKYSLLYLALLFVVMAVDRTYF